MSGWISQLVLPKSIMSELVLNFEDVWRFNPKFYNLPKTITPKSIVVLNLAGFDFKFEDLIPQLDFG